MYRPTRDEMYVRGYELIIHPRLLDSDLPVVRPLDWDLSLTDVYNHLVATYPELAICPVNRGYLHPDGYLGNGCKSCGVCDVSARFMEANPAWVEAVFTPSLPD